MKYRHPKAIANEIAAIKEAFDTRYLEGTARDTYTRAQLLTAWKGLQAQITDLTAELLDAELWQRRRLETKATKVIRNRGIEDVA